MFIYQTNVWSLTLEIEKSKSSHRYSLNTIVDFKMFSLWVIDAFSIVS